MEHHPASTSAFGMGVPGAGEMPNSSSSATRRRNRTNYRCSKCGQPKRGHVCPYQPRVLRTDGEAPPETRTIGVQVEIDSRLVVRHLQLEAQGLPESYGEAPSQQQQQQQQQPAGGGGVLPPSTQEGDVPMTSASSSGIMPTPASTAAAVQQPPPPPPPPSEPAPGAPMLFS